MSVPAQRRLSDVSHLRHVISARWLERGRPIVVGVSGFAGSGKSTLVRDIVEGDPSMVRMRGDDFLDPSRSHFRSSDWDGVDRHRLVSEVLIPFRDKSAGVFRRYDWSRRELGQPEPVPAGDVLVVDLIGLFHPEALPVRKLDRPIARRLLEAIGTLAEDPRPSGCI